MNATCHLHTDRAPSGLCHACGKPACADCLVELDGATYCKPCLRARMQAPRRTHSGFVRLVLSVVPGAGHMYLGLMNRGLQLMTLTFGIATLLNLLSSDVWAMLLATSVFYSVFDCREASLRLKQGQEVPDSPLVAWNTLSSSRLVAYALILVGVLGIYKVMVRELGSWLALNSIAFFRFARAMEGTFIGGAAIAVGIWLLKRGAPQAVRDGGEHR